MGVAGYGMAGLFVLHGAPDLALTQMLVETVTRGRVRAGAAPAAGPCFGRPAAARAGRIAIGVAVGLSTCSSWRTWRRSAGTASRLPGLPEVAVSTAAGSNIVNVTLVDIRAWDTMGEISVLVVAATGVASLIFAGPRRSAPPRSATARPAAGRAPAGRPRWLLAGGRSAPGGGRSSSRWSPGWCSTPWSCSRIYLLFSGHNAPGGGFAGGLVAGLALIVRYLAGGRYELDEAAPVDAGMVLGAGLFVAVGTGVRAAAVRRARCCRAPILDCTLPVLGDVHLVTSLFFDIGVYLVVVGLVLDILRSLGAEIDRQHEADRRASAGRRRRGSRR